MVQMALSRKPINTTRSILRGINVTNNVIRREMEKEKEEKRKRKTKWKRRKKKGKDKEKD